MVMVIWIILISHICRGRGIALDIACGIAFLHMAKIRPVSSPPGSALSVSLMALLYS